MERDTTNAVHAVEGERGFGLIEIVISMFLLALLAVAFLPLLITAMKTTVQTSSVATSSQLLSRQLDAVRTLEPNCSAISGFDDIVVATTISSRGTVFQPHRQVLTCPTTYPGVVNVRVWVTEAGKVKVLSEATTLVYVKAATP